MKRRRYGKLFFIGLLVLGLVMLLSAPRTTTTTIPCTALWSVTSITTIGKGQSPTNNPKLSHTIVGNIVDPASYAPTAARITLCAGTSARALISDSTGTPGVTPVTPGITCMSSGTTITCSVGSLTTTEKYIAVSSDGSDTDRITLLPQ